MKDAVLLAPRALLDLLRQDLLLLLLVLICAGLTIWYPPGVEMYPQLVDWPTIASLAGLILLTTGLEESGFLQHAAFHVITRMHTERRLAFLLVGASAALATVLTNDIALLIVVPLTLGLHGMAALPTARLVIFEAMAANAGSVLTPMGNPQNLFLWRHSALPFHVFVGEMLPLAAILVGLLLVFTALAFRARPIDTHEDIAPPALRRKLLWTSLLLYPLFVLLVDRHQPYWGLALVLGVYLAAFRQIVTRVDWALIAVFVLMFIDLRAIARLDEVQTTVAHLGLADAQHLYGAGVALSQLISNVPAAILLAEHSTDWRVIAYGVNVGGFGLLIGSLANIIALRLLGERRAWLVFHAYSVPYLALATGLAFAWLFLLPG
jgi:Na+/H+ antiporter NhaD/arsenite permease-like protein